MRKRIAYWSYIYTHDKDYPTWDYTTKKSCITDLSKDLQSYPETPIEFALVMNNTRIVEYYSKNRVKKVKRIRELTDKEKDYIINNYMTRMNNLCTTK